MAIGKSATRRIAILGSTGSVGTQTIDLIERNRDAYEVEALTANGNVALLARQARALNAKFAVVADPRKYTALKEALAGTRTEVAAGPEALIAAAERPSEWVMAAIVGAAGLAPTLAAVKRGVTVALANKECLVCAGDLMMREVAERKATLLPVDSEHSAIFQVFDFAQKDKVEKVILTASGGPFRDIERGQMARVTPEQAVAHPNWDMGAKISVDSATMMNKGLELIEAHHLFGLADDRLDILVHPQSIIHSMVAYVDGSVLAQLGTPDMRTPIAYALGWPQRIAAPSARLNLAEIGQLTFQPPDPERFPAIRLARCALQSGGAMPTILNAANEIAVHGFLARRIGFLDIARIVEDTLERCPARPFTNLDDVRRIDESARAMASELMGSVGVRA
ncbi:MAG TPA: 1-deoxy-D-xylulose-5-phosphate reductoisomerase [Alphaproteobacteria bacterium]